MKYLICPYNGQITEAGLQDLGSPCRFITAGKQGQISRDPRNVLRQTIETSYNEAQAAVKVYDAAKKQVDALEESFRATEKSYNLGAVNFVDYQVASFNLFSARSNLLRSKFDYIFKLKVLDFYLGNPLAL